MGEIQPTTKGHIDEQIRSAARFDGLDVAVQEINDKIDAMSAKLDCVSADIRTLLALVLGLLQTVHAIDRRVSIIENLLSRKSRWASTPGS